MKYYLNQKVLSLKDTFKIKNEAGKILYEVSGKMFTIRNKLTLTNAKGEVLLTAKKPVFNLTYRYNIFTPDDKEVAMMKRKFSIRPNFLVQLGKDRLDIDGNLIAHKFDIKNGKEVVASVKKALVSWGDVYSIDILDEENTELYLFIVVIIDQVMHDNSKKGNNAGWNF